MGDLQKCRAKIHVSCFFSLQWNDMNASSLIGDFKSMTESIPTQRFQHELLASPNVFSYINFEIVYPLRQVKTCFKHSNTIDIDKWVSMEMSEQ